MSKTTDYKFNDYKFRLKDCLFGVQTLFIALGALVLVPIITGLDPNVALLTAGSGTLIFQFITRGQVPIFLGSSFAFVPATIYGIQTWGLPDTLCGLAMGGLAYLVFAFLVKYKGPDFIDRILPPIITGPVIICIGLILAPISINMAMGKTGSGEAILFDEHIALIIAFISLGATIITRLFAKGKWRLMPILVGVSVGYVASIIFGIVNFAPINDAAWFAIPNFTTPTWNFNAVILMVPLAIISAIEHIGDIATISAITGRNYIRYPGLHRTLIGDGIATCWASLMGGPPNTTYSEVTAGVALTKMYNPGIMTWSCIIAMTLAFSGKVGAFLLSIPTPVMGGILILLFGAIAVTGLNLLAQSKQDLMSPRNMTIIGIILVMPVGGLSIGSGDFALNGIGLGGIFGVILHLILPKGNEEASLTT